MGHIKEPIGVDLIVGPSTYTEKDKQMISEIIENYKRTGKRPIKSKITEDTRPEKGDRKSKKVLV